MTYSLRHYLRLVYGPEPLRGLRPGLTLEVGSGAFPLWQADVLSDRHLADSSHRSSRALLVDGRPMVICDAVSLPFPDKAFDFVVCRHALEHMSDPARVLSELGRVASRGYIETPSPMAESLLGWKRHLWSVEAVDQNLVLRRSSPGAFGDLFHELYARDRHFAAFFDARPDLFLTRYLWTGQPKWTVLDEPADPAPPPGPRSTTLPAPNAHKFPAAHRLWHASTMVLRRARERRAPTSLEGMLSCPGCRGEVAPGTGGDLQCRSCGKTYRARDGRYAVLLPLESGNC